MVPAPLTADGAVDRCWGVLWDLLRGAAQLKQPAPGDLAKRYAEVLADNLGQPGFRELVILAHDLDAHSDLVFALVAESRRRDLFRRPTAEAAELRRAEVIDLSGVGRDYLADAIAAALAVPMATEPHAIAFAPDAYWRGETHRVCDRPSGLVRLLDELVEPGRRADPGRLGCARIAASPCARRTQPRWPRATRRIPPIVGSGRGPRCDAGHRARPPACSRSVPHTTLSAPSTSAAATTIGRIGGSRSTSSMSRGYEDAYHQFIEPVVGASGERVGT